MFDTIRLLKTSESGQSSAFCISNHQLFALRVSRVGVNRTNPRLTEVIRSSTNTNQLQNNLQIVLRVIGVFRGFRLLPLPFPYRSLHSPYRYITGPKHAFRPIFMRVLIGPTGPAHGPAPMGGLPVVLVPVLACRAVAAGEGRSSIQPGPLASTCTKLRYLPRKKIEKSAAKTQRRREQSKLFKFSLRLCVLASSR